MITPDDTSIKPSIGLLLNTMLLCIHEAYRTKDEAKQEAFVNQSEDAKRQAIEQFAALAAERDAALKRAEASEKLIDIARRCGWTFKVDERGRDYMSSRTSAHYPSEI